MAELIYSKKKELILIYFIFILIKFIKIFILEINAVPQDLGVRWQLLNTNLLEKDLLLYSYYDDSDCYYYYYYCCCCCCCYYCYCYNNANY